MRGQICDALRNGVVDSVVNGCITLFVYGKNLKKLCTAYLRVLLNVYSRRPVLASKMSPRKMTVSALVNSALVPE